MPSHDRGPQAPCPPPATRRRRHGDAAERHARRTLEAAGWHVLGVNVRVGRDELDLVTVEPPRTTMSHGAGSDDPDSAPTLVFVEVRSHATGSFGAPEESVDRRKVQRLYRAAMALVRAGCLPDGTPLPKLPWRIDLIAVEARPWIGAGVGGVLVRHVRALRPD